MAVASGARTAGLPRTPRTLAFAEAVADTLREHRWLVAEAGTGTGKTYAYLVPALLSGRRVIVSTGTRTWRTSSSIATCRCWVVHWAVPPPWPC